LDGARSANAVLTTQVGASKTDVLSYEVGKRSAWLDLVRYGSTVYLQLYRSHGPNALALSAAIISARLAITRSKCFR
jgi:hypothetical protein